MAKPFAVTDANFEEKVVQSPQPVLVDFWAEWCGPCKMIAPLIEDLAEEYDGQVQFAKLDVDTNIQTATAFGIRSIPTLLVFKDGRPVDQIIGAVPKAAIKKRLETVLSR